MDPVLTAITVMVALFGSAWIGLRLGRRLPDHHQSEETKEAVRIGMGAVATMAALVLGLQVASTKTAYDTEKNEIILLASRVVFLDRTLANYGPEAAPSRAVLQRALQSTILRLWPAAELGETTANPGNTWGQELPVSIQRLVPADDLQRAFKSQAAQLAAELGQLRWLMSEQTESSISVPLLFFMVSWFALTFLSVGLFARSNATVILAQLMAALSVAGAIFLILELDQPFHGFVQISINPMMNALSQLTP